MFLFAGVTLGMFMGYARRSEKIWYRLVGGKEGIQMKGGQRKEARAPCCERDKGREKGDVRLISDLSRLGSSIIAHCALWLGRIII